MPNHFCNWTWHEVIYNYLADLPDCGRDVGKEWLQVVQWRGSTKQEGYAEMITDMQANKLAAEIRQGRTMQGARR